MTEPNQGVQVQEETASASVEPKVEEKPVDVQAQIDAAKAEIELKYKNEIAGLNRKTTDLQKSLKEKELEGKSEEERLKALQLEKEQILKDIENLNRGRIVDKTLNGAGLPLDFAKRIIGEDEAAIVQDVKDFSEYVEKLAQERADKIINERMSGKAPENGKAPTGLKIKNIDFMAMPAKERAAFVAKGGTVESAIN